MSVTDTSQGVFVVQVFQKGWAEQGGVMHGDIITGFNRRRVGDVAKFQKLLIAASPERRTPLKVLRDGKRLRLNVMVGEGEMEGVILPTPATAAQGLPAAILPGVDSMAGGNFAPRATPHYMCPGCGFKVRHQAGVPVHMLKCPKDGSQMIREDLMRVQAPGAGLQGGQGVYPWSPQGGAR